MTNINIIFIALFFVALWSIIWLNTFIVGDFWTQSLSQQINKENSVWGIVDYNINSIIDVSWAYIPWDVVPAELQLQNTSSSDISTNDIRLEFTLPDNIEIVDTPTNITESLYKDWKLNWILLWAPSSNPIILNYGIKVKSSTLPWELYFDVDVYEYSFSLDS